MKKHTLLVLVITILQYKFDRKARDITDGYLWNAPSNFLPQNQSKILDLGGGSGNFGRQLKTKDNIVINLDITPERFDHKSGIKNIVGDIHSLPFENNFFDIILARAILHHTNKLDMVLSEIKRVLKPKGWLLIEDPLAYNPFATIVRKTISTDIHDPDEKPFKPKTLIRKVEEYFKITRIEYHTLLSYPLPTIVYQLPESLKPFGRKMTFLLTQLDKKLLKCNIIKNFCGYILIITRNY